MYTLYIYCMITNYIWYWNEMGIENWGRVIETRNRLAYQNTETRVGYQKPEIVSKTGCVLGTGSGTPNPKSYRLLEFRNRARYPKHGFGFSMADSDTDTVLPSVFSTIYYSHINIFFLPWFHVQYRVVLFMWRWKLLNYFGNIGNKSQMLDNLLKCIVTKFLPNQKMLRSTTELDHDFMYIFQCLLKIPPILAQIFQKTCYKKNALYIKYAVHKNKIFFYFFLAA